MHLSENEDIRLAVQVETAHSAIKLGYQVENMTSAAVFLFDILHEEMGNDGIYELDRSGYVEISGYAAIVSRKLFPVPELMFVEKPNIPFVTRVLPGCRHEGVLRVRLPLRQRDPYRPDPPTGGIMRGVETFFELGYFVGRQGTEALGSRFMTSDGYRAGFDAFSPTAQKLQRTGPLGRFPAEAEALAQEDERPVAGWQAVGEGAVR